MCTQLYPHDPSEKWTFFPPHQLDTATPMLRWFWTTEPLCPDISDQLQGNTSTNSNSPALILLRLLSSDCCTYDVQVGFMPLCLAIIIPPRGEILDRSNLFTCARPSTPSLQLATFQTTTRCFVWISDVQCHQPLGSLLTIPPHETVPGLQES